MQNKMLYEDIEKICSRYRINAEKKRVLEVKSGKGIFQDLFSDYMGIDSDKEFSDQYHKPFICGDIESMPFKDDEFDFTLKTIPFEGGEDIEAVLNEMMRITRKGGHIIIAFPKKSLNLNSLFKIRINHVDRYAMIRWFEKKGCICVSHRMLLRKYLCRSRYIDILNGKNSKKLITFGDLSKGIHLRRNLEMFESMGMVCESLSIRKLVFTDIKKYDILYLNWFENIDKYDIVNALIEFATKYIVLKRARKNGLKILYTKHNILPHNRKYLKLIRILYRMALMYADQIICFTADSADDIGKLFPDINYKDRVNIIHPINFNESLPEKGGSKIKEMLKPYRKRMIVTLFGWVRGYKNPLLFIEAAGLLKEKEIQFVLIGKAPDQKLKEEIIRKAADKDNVVLDLTRIDDGDLYELVKLTDVFVTPYEKGEASNSGVGRLAFSYGKTVITTDIASMKIIPDELIYKYDYIDNSDHLKRLVETIDNVYEIWKKNPDILKNQGEKLKKLMDSDYSGESISREYKKVFAKMFPENQ